MPARTSSAFIAAPGRRGPGSRQSAITHDRADEQDLQVSHPVDASVGRHEPLDRRHEGVEREGLGQVAGAPEFGEQLRADRRRAGDRSRAVSPQRREPAPRSRSQPVSPGRFRSRMTTSGRRPPVEGIGGGLGRLRLADREAPCCAGGARRSGAGSRRPPRSARTALRQPSPIRSTTMSAPASSGIHSGTRRTPTSAARLGPARAVPRRNAGRRR